MSQEAHLGLLLTMMKMLTLTNVLTLTVHQNSLRVRSYKDTKLLCPYWKTLYMNTEGRLYGARIAD